MVARVDGPFDYYADLYGGVDGDTIRADAYGSGVHVDALHALSAELEGDSRRVADDLEGDLTGMVAANAMAGSAVAASLAAKGRYAVGLLGSFAGMVDVFDLTVTALNEQYATDVATGLRAVAYAEATGATSDAGSVRPSVRARLMPGYRAAINRLDGDADVIAEKFRQGASAHNVVSLMRAGLIPLSAAGLYPGVRLTPDDRAAYFRALALLPSAPDPDDVPDEEPAPEVHWWDHVADAAVDTGAWAYNHTVVPGVNGAVALGHAGIERPEDLLAMATGAGMIALGSAGEVGGGALDATGIGAVVGVPVNVACGALIASGGALTAAGSVDLVHHATEQHPMLRNEAEGAPGRAGDPLPDSSRPDAAGSDWKGVVAQSGRGDVWQNPENFEGVGHNDANSIRIMDPTPRYPGGYVRFYNEHGQPIDLEGKPTSNAKTHIPREPDGSYPVPEGWSP